MKKFQLIFVFAIMLAAVFGFASRNAPSLPKGVTTPGGLENVELVDIPWMIGDWVHALDHSKEMSIEHISLGTYSMKGHWMFPDSTITVFNNGCDRLVEFVMPDDSPGRTEIVFYAKVNGYSQRLSMDLLPAVFPQAWSDLRILKAVGVDDKEEQVPQNHRSKALAYCVKMIDEEGVFMYQDLTFYRPSAFEESITEMVDD
tara:strand:+ start:226 stop:828 length:603 start_codon:yes stop_codon:yes gene_type:complete